MRITDVFIRNLGPFQQKNLLSLSFDDNRVLLRGLSGSGKSTLLSVISYLWCKAGQETRQGAEAPLRGNSFVGMVIKNYEGETWFIFEGHLEPREKTELETYCPKAKWLNLGKNEFLPKSENHPNILLFDQSTAHFCQNPKGQSYWFLTDENIREALYRSTDVNGAFKKQLIQSLDEFLLNKQLFWEKEHLYIKPLGSDEQLSLSSLSTGEKGLFYLFYGILAFLKPQGVLLLDEPAFYLHPNQIKAILTAIEGICRQKKAQLIIVSHNIEAWERYEALGLVVDLSPHSDWRGSEDE